MPPGKGGDHALQALRSARRIWSCARAPCSFPALLLAMDVGEAMMEAIGTIQAATHTMIVTSGGGLDMFIIR